MRIPESVPWVSTGKTLGSGGQAVVHLVTSRDESNDKKYALKVLKNVNSQQAKERFSREIEVVKGLNSPLIAKIIDHSEPEDEFQYYTMEYYEGARTLANIIYSGLNPFYCNTQKCLALFKKLVLCIQVCEQANPRIVHRDINPKNILVLNDNTIRLIDFGICQIQDGQILTLIDEDVGTRNYTAPECEAGNDSIIGVHSDLYSAAKVLWSTITSQHAFARERPVFENRSMKVMFPQDTLPQHLDTIFENTIRSDVANRISTTLKMLELISEVEYLVERNYPPLSEVGKRCPSCGRASIGEFPQGHSVFGNPNPRGIKSLLCAICGFGFVRDINKLRYNYSKFLNAE